MKHFRKKIECVIMAVMLLAGCFFVLPDCAAHATERCDIIGCYSSEESLYFYVSGLSGTVEDAFCKVEGSTGVLKEVAGTEEETLHTLILWDAVTPYDEVKQEYLKEVLGELFANRSANEVFTIAQAGEKLVYSVERSEEYAELIDIVNELGNGEDEGVLLPAVYDSVRDLMKAETIGINRLIVVTDGGKEVMDPSEKEQLAVLLERVSYPVYVMEWPADEEATEPEDGVSEVAGEDICDVLEAMGAERITCGMEQSPLDVATGLSKEYNVVRIETSIPEGERDGSKKKVELSVVTSEGVFTDVCVTDVPARSAKPVEQESFSLLRFLQKYKEWLIWCGAGATGFVLIVLFLVLRRKKKIYQIAKENYDRDAEAATVSRQYACSEEDATLMHKIKLINRADEMNTYQSGFKGAVIIGRNPNSCTLLVNGDNSLSARHCGIYVRRGHFYIRDLNSSNGTKVNGIPLTDEIEIRSGDVVKLGRTEFLIRLE